MSAPRVTMALDTETELITDRNKAPRLVCVSWSLTEFDCPTSGIFKWDDLDALRMVEGWLTNPDMRIVGQNIAYDMGVLCRQWPDLIPLVWQAYADDRITDTSIRQKLIDIAKGEYGAFRVGKSPYSLATLAKRHLGLDLDKTTFRLDYWKLIDTPLEEWPEGAKQYAIDDATSTLGVWAAQEPESEWLEDQYRQTRHAWWLHLIACWGIRTDRAQVAVLKQQIERDWTVCRDLLLDRGLMRKEMKKGEATYVRNTSAAKDRMVEIMGGEQRCKTTDSGAVSLDKDACKSSGDPLLNAYADLSHLTKILSTDIPQLETGEIHARFEPLLETGRSSCLGYNLQNPSRKGGIRECFIPRKGYVFADADYDGLELRTMAQACLDLVGESSLADVLNAGEDPHLDLAAQLLGISYEEAKRRKNDKEVEEARQFAKIPNFGKPGGMGIPTLVEYAKANGVMMSEEKAAELSHAWINRWPEFRRYFARASQMTSGGDAQAEQLYSKRFRGGLTYSELCNTYFQGLGADAAKSAGWAVSRACYDPTAGSVLFGSRIVNFVHDQFIVEVPEDIAHECATELGRLMVEEANKWLPDVPATTTPCLSRYWAKGAKAVYDADGRLIPWEPKKENAA